MLFLQRRKDVVHHGLECGRRVGKSEEHHCWFIKTIFGFKCRLMFVPRLDSDIVISPSDVKFSEHVGFFNLGDKFRDKGEGVLISNSVFVETAVILDWAEFFVLLCDKEEG